MAAYNKFEQFVQDLGLAEHNLNTDALHVYLSNAAPSASLDAVKADLAEIGTGNGYSADGIDTLNTFAEAGGVATLTGTKAVWTCVTAAMAQFRYVVLMNFTNAAPLKPLLGWWDYGSGLTLQVGETFSVRFNSSDTTGTILTIT